MKDEVKILKRVQCRELPAGGVLTEKVDIPISKKAVNRGSSNHEASASVLKCYTGEFS